MTGRSDVLINDFAGHPFQFDLAVGLFRRGFDVHHAYCSTNVTPHASFDDVGVSIHPISTGRGFDKYRPVRRLVGELTYGLKSAGLLARLRPSVAISSNVPLFSLALVSIACSILRVRHVLWLQDLQSGLATLAQRRRIGRTLTLLEGWLIRRAFRVVAISDDFRTAAIRLGARSDRVEVIENWAPLNEMPVRPRHNAWSRAHDLDDRFVFLYSGTLGLKHRPELLLALAETFECDKAVRVVVVSEGAGADWLKAELTARPQPNMVVLPFQPFEQLADVLASADVLVSLLDPAAGRFSVPSKVLSYLCAARPILAAMPSENAASRLIVERAQAGVNVPTADPSDLAAAAVGLRRDAEARTRFGRQAREYAEKAFAIGPIVERFTQIAQLEEQA